MFKIATIAGYEIHYDDREKVFMLLDGDKNEVATAPTQAELEDKAKKLSKETFKPIPAFHIRYDDTVSFGRITSLNKDQKAVYFSYDNKSAGSTSKIHLGQDRRVYECSEHNNLILSQLNERRLQKEALHKEIADLIDQLEKPIDLKYFGLKARY